MINNHNTNSNLKKGKINYMEDHCQIEIENFHKYQF